MEPVRRATGSRSPRPLTCGWSTERTGATTTETGPVSGSSGRGWARRRSTARRRPTVSLRGLSRSCGRVSQDGYSTTPSGGSRERRAAARSSASRPVAVTASTGRPVSRARAAIAKGRAAGGPTRSTCMRLPSAAAEIASARAVSLTTASSRPCRLIRGAFRAGVYNTTGPTRAAGRGVSSVRLSARARRGLWTRSAEWWPVPPWTYRGAPPPGPLACARPAPDSVGREVTRKRPGASALLGRRRRALPPQPPCAVAVGSGATPSRWRSGRSSGRRGRPGPGPRTDPRRPSR